MSLQLHPRMRMFRHDQISKTWLSHPTCLKRPATTRDTHSAIRPTRGSPARIEAEQARKDDPTRSPWVETTCSTDTRGPRQSTSTILCTKTTSQALRYGSPLAQLCDIGYPGPRLPQSKRSPPVPAGCREPQQAYLLTAVHGS